ncbi:MAG: hypothetical protein ACTHJV_00890 [Rhizobiaceae bacterium]
MTVTKPPSNQLLPQVSLTAYHPSLRETLAWYLANALGSSRYGKQDIANTATQIMDFVPGLGEALNADDLATAAQNHNWRNALIDAGGLALGAIPVAGSVAGKEFKRLAHGAFEMDYFGQPLKVLQNPTTNELKGFLNRTSFNAARRIIDPSTGETYVWDAAEPALHQHVADQLGLSPHSVFDIVGSD